MIADVAQCILNAVLIAGILRVSGGTPLRSSIVQLLGNSGLAYVGYGVVGFLFVVLWIPAGVGWFSAVLVLAPLFVARWAFEQYGEEFRAHERTLRALVSAEEKKEAGNIGHSERVGQLSEWIAEAIGLGHKETQDVRTAGMLHDVGTVAVPSRLLRGREPLTDAGMVELAAHARAGVRLVEGIGFLRDSLEGIAHHHERFDGRGYPSALAGQEIPMAARIVAVADTFDALTTPRPYRAAHTTVEALRMIHERAGVQFDPVVCDALTKALARHPWAHRGGESVASGSADAVMHYDEPEFSDLLAERADLRALVRDREIGASTARQAAGRAGMRVP
nr:HD domain-containing phosphohydrolase [Knoellia sp. DB2414S]